MKKIPYILLVSFAIFASSAMPFAASAQSATTTPPTTGAQAYQFQSDGIYGCNRTSAAASSVGAFSASGSYVPVADAAVELNTGYLVYLDCTLNPLVSALSGSATIGLTQKILSSFNTGNNGNPQFSVNIPSEQLTILNNSAVKTITGIANAVNPSFKSSIQSALARAYSANTQNPMASLSCPYTSTQSAGNIWTGIATIAVPTCDVIFDNALSYDQVAAAGASAIQNYMTQLQWGQGVIPITDANGNVVTPGSVILGQTNQAIQSGFTKTESAVAIGQMVNALFAGIGTQAISSAQGLAGITQSSGGQPSYISQAVTAASQAVQTSAVNAAITTLNGVLTTVTGYKNALDSIASTFIQTIQSLQGTENQCWSNIIQNVCVAGSIHVNNGVETCTQIPGPAVTTTTTGTGSGFGSNNNQTTTTSTPAPITLKIATSSAFSYAVIHSGTSPSIADQAQSVAAQIQTAQASLNAVNQLVAGVTNTTSQDAQSLALQQLDQLTASNSFPSPTTISTVIQEQTGITEQMQSLLNQTVQTWEGYDENGTQDLSWDGTVSANTVGWCNYNDQRTLAEWEGVWKQ